VTRTTAASPWSSSTHPSTRRTRTALPLTPCSNLHNPPPLLGHSSRPCSSHPQKFSPPHLLPSSLHHLITSSPHPFITSSLHHLIPSSPHPLITSSLNHLISSSPHHLITSSAHHLISPSPHHLLPSPPHQLITLSPHPFITPSPHHLITSSPHPFISSSPRQVAQVNGAGTPASGAGAARAGPHQRISNKELHSKCERIVPRPSALAQLTCPAVLLFWRCRHEQVEQDAEEARLAALNTPPVSPPVSPSHSRPASRDV